MPSGRLLAVFLAALFASGMACPQRGDTISRDRAIEIARSHVPFQPNSVEAERAESRAGAVWRVTFRGRLPGQPPGLFETTIVEIDRASGRIVSIGRS
jgi:hypothetical protein